MSTLKRSKCPVCGDYFWVPVYTVDFVHECRNADRTRKAKRSEKFHAGTRQTIKWDADWWTEFGTNPQKPLGRISKTEWKKMMKEQVNVDTHVEV